MAAAKTVSLNGGILSANGFGDDYQSELVSARSTTTSSTFQTKTTLTTPALTGTYRVAWHAVVDGTSAGGNGTETEARLQNTTDATTVGAPNRYTPTDVDDRVSVGGFDDVAFTGSAKTFEVQFRRAGGSGSSGIQDAHIELWRIGS